MGQFNILAIKDSVIIFGSHRDCIHSVTSLPSISPLLSFLPSNLAWISWSIIVGPPLCTSQLFFLCNTCLAKPQPPVNTILYLLHSSGWLLKKRKSCCLNLFCLWVQTSSCSGILLYLPYQFTPSSFHISPLSHVFWFSLPISSITSAYKHAIISHLKKKKIYIVLQLLLQ